MKYRNWASVASERQLLKAVEESADQRAVVEFEERARNGDPEIYGMLGKLYLQGYGALRQDCAKAHEYFKAGMKRGAPILCPLAYSDAFFFGVCVEKDHKRAFQLIEQVAVNTGDWIAEARLSQMYEFGHGCRQDLDAAAEWMYKAWQSGVVIGLSHYGRILIKSGRYFRGHLIRLISWFFLPLVFLRGLSDRRNRIW